MLLDCNQILHYDISEFNWYTFWLLKVQEKYPKVDNLELVHLVLSPSEIFDLLEYCADVCRSQEFQHLATQYYKSLFGHLEQEWMIQRVFNVRINTPDCESLGKLVQFHTDGWTGNGDGITTVWTPITESYDSNSLWVLDNEKSLMLSEQIILNKWDYDRIQEEAVLLSEPLTLSPGECYAFSSKTIHGCIKNVTGKSRWSMDGRILVKGKNYHRKTPGGYFRDPDNFDGQREIPINSNWAIYAGWSSKFSYNLPALMQRQYILSYAKKIDINIVSNGIYENEGFDWFPSLKKSFEMKSLDGIFMLSILCLPDNANLRHEILKHALNKNKQIYFVNEEFLFKNQIDLEYIDKIFGYVSET